MCYNERKLSLEANKVTTTATASLQQPIGMCFVTFMVYGLPRGWLCLVSRVSRFFKLFGSCMDNLHDILIKVEIRQEERNLLLQLGRTS